MAFKNKWFFTLLTLVFMILGSLHAQDNAAIDLRKANQLLTVAQERDRLSSEELEEVKSRRLRMEEDLMDVQDNPKLMSKEDKKKLENDIKTLRKHEELVLYKRKLASNLMLDVTDILKATPKKRAKFISEYEKRVAPIVLNTNTEEITAMQTPATVSQESKTKTAKDPIAELEKQASAPPKQTVENTSTASKSKPKKESSKKPKEEKPKEAVVEIAPKKTEPKPKKESSKKPKEEKPKEVVAETTTVKTDLKPKKESSKKPKEEKPKETVVETTTKAEPKPKKEPSIKPETDKQKAAVAKTRSKQKKETPRNEIPPVVVTEPIEKQTETTTGVVVKQPDTTVAGKFGNFLETMTEAVPTQTETVPTNPEPKKKKGKEPKAPKIVSVRVPSDNTVVTALEPKKKKEEDKPKTPKPRAESSKSTVVYKKYDAKEDPMLITPSTLDCNLAFDGKDNFTGKKKQETTPIILFAHTDDFMRAAMKNKEFVTCEATATRVEGSRTVYLNLTITVQSKDAQRSFGFIDRGALIIFRFINGKKLSLATNKTDIGIVDVDKGTTTFRAQLAIAETIEYTASELDAIRVSWSIGYEDYEIFDMDVMRNLFKCLDKK